MADHTATKQSKLRLYGAINTNYYVRAGGTERWASRGETVDWSIVRICRVILRDLTARRHELSAAGALVTCFAVVLNIGPLTRSPISHGVPQLNPDRQMPQRYQAELPNRLRIDEGVYDPTNSVIKLSHTLMAWASIYDAPGTRPTFPISLGNDDAKTNPQEPRPLDDAGPSPSPNTIIGIWAPDDGACSDRTLRDGVLPAVITERGARAGKTHCVFKNQKQTEKDWRAVANCSNSDEHWTTHVRLTVKGNRLIWTSKRGTQVYMRCKPDVHIADAG
jgi:hypothetical protein